jgi:hypothetical protein
MSTGIFIARSDIHDFYHSGLVLEALAQADLSWWEQALASGLREQVQPRDFCTLGIACGRLGRWERKWKW